MRAMILRATGDAGSDRLEPAERPRRDPEAGEITVAVEACGVCRTDLHIVEGEVDARLPVVPGHQVAGRVAAVGPGVERFRPGDPVGVGWRHRTCGRCRFCRDGRENLCEAALDTGRHVDGGYAEFMIADAAFAYPLPPDLPPADAAPLLCAGIIGYRTLRLSGIRPGGRLGLVGFGASAHLAIQVARSWKCEVFVFTRQAHHRRLALEMGAAWAGGAEEDPGVLLDAAAIFAPAGELVSAMLARLDRGATIAVNAIHMTPIPGIAFADLYWERAIRTVANSTRRDAEEFLALAAAVPVRARVETFRLEEANTALRRVKSGGIDGAAVLRIAR